LSLRPIAGGFAEGETSRCVKSPPSRSSSALVLSILLAVSLGVSCATGGRDSARESVEPDASVSRPYVDADVRFIHNMIAHHEQALVMTDLVPIRSENEDLRRLAQRIDISQRDEIARMKRWLEARRESVPEGHAHGPLMPGMLTEEEVTRLAAATGAEFDRLFLEFMMRHHEGALVMVADLFSTAGAGQEPELFTFASHVDADQRSEIARMRDVCSELSEGGNQ
jgi:uncharacterized protein (DUF305 family)